MKLDFLKDFHKRMKKTGMYTLLNYNSMLKGTWKIYGFEESYEHVNFLYAVMMFIMEQSLKDEICTMDDVAGFIDEINSRHFRKNLNYEKCRELADFIVNTILCNDGKVMYFKGYEFEKKVYEDIHIAYVKNKIVEVNGINRTSYYFTDDGYSMLLGTLEIENNMKLTIQEMIFKLHLEKADYDKAVDDIKLIFDYSRRQLQKIEESIRRIKENVLNFSSEEYESLLDENMDIIKEHRNKFNLHKQNVNEKIEAFYEQEIDIDKLQQEDLEKLDNLGKINFYLSKVIGDQQRILSTHFDFKKAYSDALTGMTTMAVIKRISFNNDIYEHVLKDPVKLDSLHRVFSPLYLSKPPKCYNINKCLQYQRVIKSKEEDLDEEISLDDESYREEKERKLKKKLLKYRGVLEVLFDSIINAETKRLSLLEIVTGGETDKEFMEILVPSVEIFREVMVDLLKASKINITELKNEVKNTIEEDFITGFELNKMILQIIEENKSFRYIKAIETSRIFDTAPVKIHGAVMENGCVKTVTCTNIEFKFEVI